MVKAIIQSLLVRVAVVLAALFVGALAFIAHALMPDLQYVDAAGQAHHAFMHPAFIWQAVVTYLMALPFVYLGTRCVIWFTQEKS